tara:strand:+ start:1690 stop:2688 length:999 start_codon:yes stop_codon:yes gene_type:complete
VGDNNIPVGVILHGSTPPEDLINMSQLVEDSGFDELWLSEDYFFLGGVSSTVAALQATRGIPVGLGIISTVVRHPAVTAMEISTMARLSPGRLMAGLGHGVPAWTQQMGLYPSSPLTAMREAVTAVRRLLNGETLSEDGRYFSFHDVVLTHPAEGVPLYCGVIGPRSLELSGEVADGTVVSVVAAPRYLEFALDAIARGATNGTKDPTVHRLPTFALYNVAANREQARAAAKPVLAFYMGAVGPTAMTDVYGINEQLADMVERGGPDVVEAEMPDEWLDTFAIAGEPDECAEKISALYSAGASSVVLAPVPAEGGRDREMIEMTASSVLPLL